MLPSPTSPLTELGDLGKPLSPNPSYYLAPEGGQSSWDGFLWLLSWK